MEPQIPPLSSPVGPLGSTSPAHSSSPRAHGILAQPVMHWNGGFPNGHHEMQTFFDSLFGSNTSISPSLPSDDTPEFEQEDMSPPMSVPSQVESPQRHELETTGSSSDNRTPTRKRRKDESDEVADLLGGESSARGRVHKLTEKNRRDRLSERYTKLQELLQQANCTPPSGKRKGRNGDNRREDILEMCERFIEKTCNTAQLLNSAICKLVAVNSSISCFQWYSQAEAQACFDAILADLWQSYLGCDKPYSIFANQVAALNYLSDKTNDPQRRLFALATTCITFTEINLQPKRGLEAAQRGWDLYSRLGGDKAPPILYQGFDVGAVFLGYKALLLAALGSHEYASIAWSEFLELTKSYKRGTLTNLLPMTIDILFRSWQGGSHSRKEYYEMLATATLSVTAPKHTSRVTCAVGYVVATTKPSEEYSAGSEIGVSMCEKASADALKHGGEFADLLMCNFVVGAYIKSGKLAEGLTRAEEYLRKTAAIESKGYPALLKSKGDCLLQLRKIQEAFVTYNELLQYASSLGLSRFEREARTAISYLQYPKKNTPTK